MIRNLSKLLIVLSLNLIVGCSTEEKKLTIDEIQWKKSGFSSGNPEIFEKFYDTLKNDQLNIYDLTDVFDQEIRQTYIDSGHLNILGNYLVSKKIAQIISD